MDMGGIYQSQPYITSGVKKTITLEQSADTNLCPDMASTTFTTDLFYQVASPNFLHLINLVLLFKYLDGQRVHFTIAAPVTLYQGWRDCVWFE